MNWDAGEISNKGYRTRNIEGDLSNLVWGKLGA